MELKVPSRTVAGEAWGFFILDEFLVMMCADMLVMAVAAIFATMQVQLTGMCPPHKPLILL